MASTNRSPSSVTSELTEFDLELEPTPLRQCFEGPIYTCVFWFLPCEFRSEHEEDWKTHCVRHFKGSKAPNELECFLCNGFNAKSCGDTTAWSQFMHHIVTQHASGHNVTRTTLPRSIARFLTNQNICAENSKGGSDTQRTFEQAERQVHYPEDNLHSAPNERTMGWMKEQSGHHQGMPLIRNGSQKSAGSDRNRAPQAREGLGECENAVSDLSDQISRNCEDPTKAVENIPEAMYLFSWFHCKDALLILGFL
jgi:hypothetical protein